MNMFNDRGINSTSEEVRSAIKIISDMCSGAGFELEHFPMDEDFHECLQYAGIDHGNDTYIYLRPNGWSGVMLLVEVKGQEYNMTGHQSNWNDKDWCASLKKLLEGDTSGW